MLPPIQNDKKLSLKVRNALAQNTSSPVDVESGVMIMPEDNSEIGNKIKEEVIPKIQNSIESVQIIRNYQFS